jgi:hypothetical protein
MAELVIHVVTRQEGPRHCRWASPRFPRIPPVAGCASHRRCSHILDCGPIRQSLVVLRMNVQISRDQFRGFYTGPVNLPNNPESDFGIVRPGK